MIIKFLKARRVAQCLKDVFKVRQRRSPFFDHFYPQIDASGDAVGLLFGPTPEKGQSYCLPRSIYLWIGMIKKWCFVCYICICRTRTSLLNKNVFHKDTLEQWVDMFDGSTCLMGRSVHQLFAHKPKSHLKNRTTMTETDTHGNTLFLSTLFSVCVLFSWCDVSRR